MIYSGGIGIEKDIWTGGKLYLRGTSHANTNVVWSDTSNSVNISSVGDISFSTGLEKHSYDFNGWISKEVREYLKADIQIGNLECVYYPNSETRPPGFNLSEKDTSAEAMLMSGFDVLSLANKLLASQYIK